MKKALIYGLAAAMLLAALAACSRNRAATIRLTKTEGTVGVADRDGREIRPQENLMVYSGYEVDTAPVSYAWMNLDDVKLAKMDEDSAIQIEKSGKDLEIVVNRGGLFFHVTEPLDGDETMNIRTSNMIVGIRGTCGWVSASDDRHMAVYIVEGTVACSVSDPDSGEQLTDTVSRGEMALLTLEDGGCEIDKGVFSLADVPDFVGAELDESLRERLPVASGTDQDTAWRLSGDGLLTISGTGAMNDYTADSPAPWRAGGLPEIRTVVIENGITRIGNRSFISCAELSKADIPDSVTSIGRDAFKNCTGLTSIVIPGSTAAIGQQAFEGCTALATVNLSPGLTEIGYGCFRFNPALEHIILPEGMKSIGDYTFEQCTALTSAVIPGSVTDTGFGAFLDCKALEQVTIGPGLKKIERCCFQHCASLASVTLPGSLKTVSRGAFSGCQGLTDVYYAGTQEEFRAVYFEGGSPLTSAAIHYSYSG